MHRKKYIHRSHECNEMLRLQSHTIILLYYIFFYVSTPQQCIIIFIICHIISKFNPYLTRIHCISSIENNTRKWIFVDTPCRFRSIVGGGGGGNNSCENSGEIFSHMYWMVVTSIIINENMFNF